MNINRLYQVVLGLILLFSGSVYAQNPKNDNAPKEKSDKILPEGIRAFWEVRGWGENEVEAKKNAALRAQPLVQGFIQEQFPRTSWQPSTEFIMRNLVGGPPTRLPEEDIDHNKFYTNKINVLKKDVGKDKFLCYSVPIIIDSNRYLKIETAIAEYEILREERIRENNSEERILISTTIVGIILVVLLLTIGYFKFVEKASGNSRSLKTGLGLFLVIVFVIIVSALIANFAENLDHLFL